MARRAVWRLGPEDPKTVAELLWAGLSGWSGGALLACLALAVPIWAYWALPLVLGIVLLLPFALALPHPPRGSSEGVATLPRLPHSYPVHVVVSVKGAVMGRDDATASFTDGWLYVEGVRASFSLRAHDGRPRYAHFSPALQIEFADGTLVHLEHVAKGGTGSGAFHADCRSWIEKAERPAGEPILPPRSAQPAVLARAFVRTALLMAIALMVVTALFLDPSSGVMPFRTRPLSLAAILMLVVPPLAPAAWFAHVLIQSQGKVRPPHRPPIAAEDPAEALAFGVRCEPADVVERLEVERGG